MSHVLAVALEGLAVAVFVCVFAAVIVEAVAILLMVTDYERDRPPR